PVILSGAEALRSGVEGPPSISGNSERSFDSADSAQDDSVWVFSSFPSCTRARTCPRSCTASVTASACRAARTSSYRHARLVPMEAQLRRQVRSQVQLGNEG